MSGIGKRNALDRRVCGADDVDWIVQLGLRRLGGGKSWVCDFGSGKHAVPEYPDIVTIVPFSMIAHRAVNNSVSGNVVASIRVDRKANTNIVNTRQEVERLPIPLTWRNVTRFNSPHVWVIKIWTVLNQRVREDG